MKKKINILLICLMVLTVLSPVVKVFALPDGQTELSSIEITGNIETESLEVGTLPSFEATTSTEHASIEAYGSNTNWAKLTNGSDNWSGFGTETPTAEDDGTFYALRLCVTLSDGYVFTENTRIVYNGRDLTDDTFSSISTFDWGGYVYVDLGQVRGEPGPSVQGNVILRVDLDVEMPRIGDRITVTENGTSSAQTQYSVNVPKEDSEYYGPDGDASHNYMYILDESGELFDGELAENEYYDMIIWLTAFDDYEFDQYVEIHVNGEYVGDYHLESEKRLGIDYLFQPIPQDVTYTITQDNGKFIATFEFPEGTDFQLDVVDILSYTPEQIESIYGIPADTIAGIVETIKENVKDYGELLSLYAIDISGPGGMSYSDAITFKILMTDEMKKYNTFKFIFVDENNNFVIQEIHDTNIETINGKDYIVVNLDHLSAYALVGSNTSNPVTADKIVFYVSMLGLSLLGLVGAGIYTKKKYFS